MASFLKILAVLGIVLFPQGASAEGRDCDVYRFQCLPEVGEISIRLHKLQCYVSYAPLETDMATLDKQGLQFADVIGKNDKNKHECTVRGHKVQVEMDGIYYNSEEQGPNCKYVFGYIMRTNWWLDGKKVVNDLRFSGGCDKDVMVYGTFIRSLVGHIPSKGNTFTHIDTADIYFKAQKSSDEILNFAVDITPPYRVTETKVGRDTFLNGVPLTNIHIHGEEGEKFKIPERAIRKQNQDKHP